MFLQSKSYYSSKCAICLPEYSDESKNSIYSRMAKEILDYAESSDDVRQYKCAFSAFEENGVETVRITLFARLRSENGSKAFKRQVTHRWKDGFLLSQTLTDVK